MDNKNLHPGEIIAIPLPFGLEHYGIFTERGTVISASMRQGCVAEESFENFSQGRRVTSKGYPSSLSASEVLSHARQNLGKSWNLLTANCQQFATACHGQKHSPQLRALVTLSVIAVVGLLAARKKYA